MQAFMIRDLALTLKQRGLQNIGRAHQINEASQRKNDRLVAKTEEVLMLGLVSMILLMKKERKMFQFIFENAVTTGYQGETMKSKGILTNRRSHSSKETNLRRE